MTNYNDRNKRLSQIQRRLLGSGCDSLREKTDAYSALADVEGGWLLLDLSEDIHDYLRSLVRDGEFEDIDAATESIIREHMRVAGEKKKVSADSKIWFAALEALGNEHEARVWMLSPQLALDYRRPVDLLDDPEDRRELLDHITRIGHGVHT